MLEVKISRTFYQCETCGAQHEDPQAISKFDGMEVCIDCIQQREDIVSIIEKYIKHLN